MKTFALLLSVLVLTMACGIAQDAANSGNENSTPGYKTTVEGCLDGAIGDYTLTDYNGGSYKLSGDTEQFKAHVGETVRLAGVVTPIAHVPLAMSEGVQTQPTLSVSSLRQISAVCNDNNNIP
jgi:hypothetical protein